MLDPNSVSTIPQIDRVRDGVCVLEHERLQGGQDVRTGGFWHGEIGAVQAEPTGLRDETNEQDRVSEKKRFGSVRNLNDLVRYYYKLSFLKASSTLVTETHSSNGCRDLNY